MRYVALSIFAFVLIAGLLSCKSNPVTPTKPADTTQKPCDTCGDTTIYHVPGPNDTTSHNFVWRVYTIPNETTLSGCWVFGQNEIYVLGNSLYKMADTGWVDITPHDSRGYSLSGELAGFTFFALNDADYWFTRLGLIFHAAGSTTAYSFGSQSGGPLNAVWGLSDNDMYAVGDYGSILHFDGSAWTPMTSGTNKYLNSISGSDDNNIWASGFNPNNGETVLLHYDGKSWKEDPLSVSLGLNAAGGFDNVWAVDSAGHHCAFTMGQVMLRKTMDGPWRKDTAAVTKQIASDWLSLQVMGSSTNDLMVYGGYGYLAHWNGSSWYPYSYFYQFDYIGTQIQSLSMSGNTVCAVGTKGNASWILIGRR
jgi:photosystem II stability/assembly factor-like uncharacterized protein